jgi:uncharacterized protein YbbC (DUF1343 family)
VLRAGAAHGLPVVVLDRPNPLGGLAVEGNVLDPSFASFVGPAPIAMRYGLTIGELGRLFNAELGIGADLAVVQLRDWSRGAWYDDTGLPWVNPSPNLRSLAAATLYPGTVLFEGTNLSEGRGTDRPFEWVGAPWVDAATWADRLNGAAPAGVRFHAQYKTPTTSKHAGRPCRGVRVEIVDRAAVRPMQLGVAMLITLRTLHSRELRFSAAQFDALAGTDEIRLALESARPASEIFESWQPPLQQFQEIRKGHLIY